MINKFNTTTMRGKVIDAMPMIVDMRCVFGGD